MYRGPVTRTGGERLWAIQRVIASSIPLRLGIGTTLLRQGRGEDLAVDLRPAPPTVARSAGGAGAQNDRRRGHATSTPRIGRWIGPTLEDYLDPGHLDPSGIASFGALGHLAGPHRLLRLERRTSTSLPAAVDAHPPLLPATAVFHAEGLHHPVGALVLATLSSFDDLPRRVGYTKTQRRRGPTGRIHAYQEKKLERLGGRCP